MKEQDAVRGGRVDVFLHAFKANSSSLQLPDALDQVFQGATQTIQFPDDGRVTGANELERRLEPFALSGRTAGDIGEELFAPSFLERISLQFELLVLGADSSVTDVHRFEDTAWFASKPVEPSGF